MLAFSSVLGGFDFLSTTQSLGRDVYHMKTSSMHISDVDQVCVYCKTNAFAVNLLLQIVFTKYTVCR